MPSDTQHAPSAYAELVVNSDYSHRVRLTADRYIIGRSDDCDILMPEADPSVSRRHAALQRDANGLWWLVDLASRNGTKVGPLRVAPDRPYQLRDGDRFQVGTNEMEFRLITTPHPIGAPPFVAPALTPNTAAPEPPTVRATPAPPTMEIPSLHPPVPTPTVANLSPSVEPTILPGTTEAASRRERTLMPQDTPPPSGAVSVPPVTPALPTAPVAPVAMPITPVTPITPAAGAATPAIPITPIAAVPVPAHLMHEPPRDEDSVYDGPTVNSREIADAYRAGEIASPGTPSAPPIPPTPTPIPSAPVAPYSPPIASPPSQPVDDSNTVKMRVDWPAANPTQGRRLDTATSVAGGPPASRPGAAYTPPSAVTPPLTVGPGSSLLSRELPSRNAGPSPATSPPDALSALDNGMPPIAIACGVLMLLSLFLPWAQTKAGAGVAFLPLFNRVGSGLVHWLLLLPALAALPPILGAFLGRNNRLLALIGGGGAGVVLSTVLLFMKPGAVKGLSFGGTGLFVYVLGALAALGIGVWVRSAGNRE
jgi:predicted component of type VI protein secretion system